MEATGNGGRKPTAGSFTWPVFTWMPLLLLGGQLPASWCASGHLWDNQNAAFFWPSPSFQACKPARSTSLVVSAWRQKTVLHGALANGCLQIRGKLYVRSICVPLFKTWEVISGGRVWKQRRKSKRYPLACLFWDFETPHPSLSRAGFQTGWVCMCSLALKRGNWIKQGRHLYPWNSVLCLSEILQPIPTVLQLLVELLSIIV